MYNNYGIYNYDNYYYRQSAKPLYMKDEKTNQVYMKYNNQWFIAVKPETLIQEEDFSLGCSCCVYRDPNNFSNSTKENIYSGECRKTNFQGWPLEATYYDCSAWGC
ncbi:hypothetical protein JI729_09730 [Bacillus sp. TK-2]|nr:hypothetical protein JI729_09730 [Bacillus sp. TK-2]